MNIHNLIFSIKINRLFYKRSSLYLLHYNLLLVHQEVENVLDQTRIQTEHPKHVILRQRTQTHTLPQNALLYDRKLNKRQTQTMTQVFFFTTQQQSSSLPLLHIIWIFSHSPGLTLYICLTYLIVSKELCVLLL